MPELVDRIERALTEGLIHPGFGDDPFIIPLPTFANTMPGEMARAFAEEAGLPHANVARLAAEAIAHLIENPDNETTPS